MVINPQESKVSAMLGKYGDIIFETSDKRILSFKEFSQNISGRWGSHSVIGKKEKMEFNGPAKRKVTFKMTFRAIYGIRPREMLERLEYMVEKGLVDYLVIGGRAVGENRFAITGLSETWDTIYSGGELAKASVTVTMEEYT